jgi:hypothetical protein
MATFSHNKEHTVYFKNVYFMYSKKTNMGTVGDVGIIFKLGY